METKKTYRVYALCGSDNLGNDVGASGELRASFVTDNGKKFVVKYMMYSATSDSVLMNITILGRQIYNVKVPIGSVAGKSGTSLAPVPVAGSMVFNPSETVIVDFKDYSAAPNTVFLSFIGYEE